MTKTLPLHISNVMYYSEKAKAPAKVRIAADKKSGKKYRELKKLAEKITK
jgi:ribosomal protein L24